MGIFSMEDPLTPQYIESQGFRTQHKPKDPTILYEANLISDGSWYVKSSTLKLYFKAAKPSKAKVCELKYKTNHIKKMKNETVRLPYPETEADLDLTIEKAKNILSKAWGCRQEAIKIYKPRY